jgi:hypothetical protein
MVIHNKKYLILIIIIIMIFINIVNCTDGYLPFFKDPHPKASENKEDHKEIIQGSGSSRSQVILSTDTVPVNITRRVVRPERADGYYQDDLIEVLVKVTSLKKDGLGYIEIWELPGDKLELIRCSYPIRTSSIKNILSYETSDESDLRKEDIINTLYIAKLLKNDTDSFYPNPYKSYPHSDNAYAYIYKILSSETQNLLTNISSEDMLDKINNALLHEFNGFINDNSTTDINVTLLKQCNIPLDRKSVYSFNSHSAEYNDLKDYKLIKRRLLERLFPGMIKNMSFYKEHEFLKNHDAPNSINVLEKDLFQDEAIIFKYYLRPTGLGQTNIRSIIRTNGYLQEETTPLKIIDRGERFDIGYWCESKDLSTNHPMKFIYYIEYLGGNDDKNNFTISVKAPEGCKIENDANWKDNIDRMESSRSYQIQCEQSMRNVTINDVSFTRGKINELIINVTYTRTGLRLSPPTISIGNFAKEFETDLSVYEDFDTPARIHYEVISLILIFLTMIISVGSIYEVYLTRKQIEHEKKEREISDKLIDDNTKVLEKLTRILNKILGD